MQRKAWTPIAAEVFCAIVLAGAPAQQSAVLHARHPGGAASTAATNSGELMVPDVELVNQDGKIVRLYSDVVKGRTVVVNFIFTSCITICPPLGATFGKLQRILAQQGDGDVELISISVDPLNDTPERLKAWAAKFNARPGWTLLTGSRENVEAALRAFRAYTADPASHSPIVVIGNEATQTWTRANGLVPASKLAELVANAKHGANALNHSEVGNK